MLTFKGIIAQRLFWKLG